LDHGLMGRNRMARSKIRMLLRLVDCIQPQ
jgi:hypothetical protein